MRQKEEEEEEEDEDEELKPFLYFHLTIALKNKEEIEEKIEENRDQLSKANSLLKIKRKKRDSNQLLNGK